MANFPATGVGFLGVASVLGIPFDNGQAYCRDDGLQKGSSLSYWEMAGGHVKQPIIGFVTSHRASLFSELSFSPLDL